MVEYSAFLIILRQPASVTTKNFILAPPRAPGSWQTPTGWPTARPGQSELENQRHCWTSPLLHMGHMMAYGLVWLDACTPIETPRWGSRSPLCRSPRLSWKAVQVCHLRRNVTADVPRASRTRLGDVRSEGKKAALAE